jgi:hypothetical protein
MSRSTAAGEDNDGLNSRRYGLFRGQRGPQAKQMRGCVCILLRLTVSANARTYSEYYPYEEGE